jgi:hypothetical protein
LKSNTETVADGADANLSTGIEIEIDGDDLVLKASAPPPDRPALTKLSRLPVASV